MDARFFGLAFLAALNPKLFAVDLLLMESRRPRLMFLCFLAGGLSMCLAVGLLAVSAGGGDGALSAEASASAGLDLAVGLLLLAVGALLAAGRLHGRRRAPAQAGEAEQDGWARRILAKPRLGLAVLVGALAGTPGGAYIAALRQLIGGGLPAAEQVFAVVVFALIEFSLVIIPFVFLVVRPAATRTQTRRAQDWLMGHARQLMAAVALFVGGYMAISGLVRLLG
jgi:Sap, sulfolipid-1-addressing protein